MVVGIGASCLREQLEDDTLSAHRKQVENSMNPQEAGQRASLRDVINYKPEQYLSDDEVKSIQSTFKNNPKLIGVLRKVMIPTIADPSLPIEEVSGDVFLNRDWAAIPADEAKILTVARQDAVKFIIGGLIKLQVIANQSVETPMEAAIRRSKDSSK